MLTFKDWLNEDAQAEVPQQAPEFDHVGNHTKTGKYFSDFFSKVSRGEFGKSNVGWQNVLDTSGHDDFHQHLNQHTGHFDDHIAKSIPTFREIQVRKGNALVKAFGNQRLSMLDIGGSEGSFAKSVTAASNGNIKTKVLDPNPDMSKFFNEKSQVSGSHYDQRAFHKGWVQDDGTEVPAMHSDNTDERYDIVHEAMVFQFVNNERATHLLEAKKLMKPDGMLITEEKLKTPQEDWNKNEAFKDQNYKNIYYSNAELAEKQKKVGFQQDKKEEKAVGMVDNMVSVPQFESMLAGHFAETWQYWDSGNFKGYVASNDPRKIRAFLQALGNVNTKFSTVQTPRKVDRTAASMVKGFEEWFMEHDADLSVLADLLPEKEKLDRMSFKHVKDTYLHKLKARAEDLELDVSDEELESWLKTQVKQSELPEFDVNHYHHHM